MYTYFCINMHIHTQYTILFFYVILYNGNFSCNLIFYFFFIFENNLYFIHFYERKSKDISVFMMRSILFTPLLNTQFSSLEETNVNSFCISFQRYSM